MPSPYSEAGLRLLISAFSRTDATEISPGETLHFRKCIGHISGLISAVSESRLSLIFGSIPNEDHVRNYNLKHETDSASLIFLYFFNFAHLFKHDEKTSTVLLFLVDKKSQSRSLRHCEASLSIRNMRFQAAFSASIGSESTIITPTISETLKLSSISRGWSVKIDICLFLFV